MPVNNVFFHGGFVNMSINTYALIEKSVFFSIETKKNIKDICFTPAS